MTPTSATQPDSQEPNMPAVEITRCADWIARGWRDFMRAPRVVTLLIGLVLMLPLIGHASWHAYRVLVRDAP